MKRTKLFLDTEFTGLHKGTTLISIGIVSECGKVFYAELTDFAVTQVDDWIKENVINNLIYADKIGRSNSSWEHWISDNGNYRDALDFTLAKKDMSIFHCIGISEMVKNRLEKWLEQFDSVEIWSDCLAYDWVLFCNIFGSAFDIPENVYYIPFDLATLLEVKGVDSDINRESLSEGSEYMTDAFSLPTKHNAIWDAFVIRACYYAAIK